MNSKDSQCKDFALVQEMLETPEVIARFDYDQAEKAIACIRQSGRLMLTGEGSSRIFPAKNFLAEAMKTGLGLQAVTEGSSQAGEYDLSGYTVIGASNSGQTKEVIALFQKLKEKGHSARIGLTANPNTLLESLSNICYLLQCGKEKAVAATKSVVEQALFYHSILCGSTSEKGGDAVRRNQQSASEAARNVLEETLNPELVRTIADASMIYFAGRNNGVAEELTLKTNEITRKKSDFLEGTYAVHGVEEVMDPTDVMIVVDPFETEEAKIRQCLVEGVRMKVIAISARDTSFPTIKIPHVWGYDTFLQLLAGWNILVSVGVHLGIDLDRPVRARKVGNEFVG